MTDHAPTATIASQTKELLTFAVRQGESLTKRAHPIASAIINATDTDRATIAHSVFLAARGEVVAAKLSNAKDRARALSKAWNRVVDAIRYHLQKSELAIRFPNLASGEGETVVQTTAEAGVERKALKLARDAADAAALEAFQSERAQAELDALRGMSPAELSAQILAMINAWSDDVDNRLAVVGLINEAFETDAVIVTAPTALAA